MSPCEFNWEIERHGVCDGHWKCYCPHCKSCGEAVDNSKDLNNLGTCKWCVEHVNNQSNGKECNFACTRCERD